MPTEAPAHQPRVTLAAMAHRIFARKAVPGTLVDSRAMAPILDLARRVADETGIGDWVRNEQIARAGSVNLDGVDLPPASIRLGGHNFEDDRDFLDAAIRDARRLQQDLGVTASSRVLDIGCGVGRLPIGLREVFARMPPYFGVDVAAGVVRWCQAHITDPEATFIHLDLANDRYNPRGKSAARLLRLPLPDRSFDAIYLYSVFSHMLMPDIDAYLHEFKRLLAPDGTVFLTAFVENDVDDVQINPPGYGSFPGDWDGPLHCVRFDRAFFEQHVVAVGLEIARFDQASDTDGQSAIYIRHSSTASDGLAKR